MCIFCNRSSKSYTLNFITKSREHQNILLLVQKIQKFNSDLLYLLGIVPTEELVNAIFKSCTYLPWEAFEDTKILSELTVPIGVISNFNSTLKEKLNQFFGPVFVV